MFLCYRNPVILAIAQCGVTPGPSYLWVANSQCEEIRPHRAVFAQDGVNGSVLPMRELLILAVHALVTCVKLRPGGVRAVGAESLLLKHQLLISNRSRQRAPNLTSVDRFLLGLTTLLMSPRRIPKLGALIKPATLLKFHKALVDRKYRLLFASSSHRRKPGPKGPSAELIAAIVEMKRRNPRFGCVRIAQQASHAFGVQVDKDVVRRVLARY
jgi:putative transposase